MKNDDGHLIELIAFLNQKSEFLSPVENEFDPLIRCLAHLKKANLLDGLWAGYRSFLNPLTERYKEISFRNDNIPMSFLFGPNTHKFIELYELKTNGQGDNDKKRFNDTLTKVTEELSYLLLSQRLLKEYQHSISFKKRVWFRDYVLSHKDRPIFILRRAALEDELRPSAIKHTRILPVYNTWKGIYLNKLKCFMDASINIIVNTLIDSDFSIFPETSSPGQFYKKVLNHIWDCQPLLHNFPFEFKEDDLFEKNALERQIKECKRLLEEDGLDNTFSPADLAKFLASTALVGPWQTNYYISTNLFEKEHQGTSYSLFFSSDDLQTTERGMTERKFIVSWRMASNLESANYMSKLLQKQERGAGISDVIRSFSHEIADLASWISTSRFPTISQIFQLNDLKRDTDKECILFWPTPAGQINVDKSVEECVAKWIISPNPIGLEAFRTQLFIWAGSSAWKSDMNLIEGTAFQDAINTLIEIASRFKATTSRLHYNLKNLAEACQEESEFDKTLKALPKITQKFEGENLLLGPGGIHSDFVRLFIAALTNSLKNSNGEINLKVVSKNNIARIILTNTAKQPEGNPKETGTLLVINFCLKRLKGDLDNFGNQRNKKGKNDWITEFWFPYEYDENGAEVKWLKCG